MNPHYHPYSDISAQHPPSPDSGNGFPQMAPGSNGGMGLGGHHMSHHHNGNSGPGSGGGGPNNNNNGPITMDGQQNFQHISNNMGPMKHCAGCGGKLCWISSSSDLVDEFQFPVFLWQVKLWSGTSYTHWTDIGTTHASSAHAVTLRWATWAAAASRGVG